MSVRPQQIGGWVLRAAVFLGLAVVITAFQVDLHSRTRLTLMAYVPPGLGGFADANAARLLAMYKPEMARERGEAALRHRPIDASTLSAYALAAVEDDDPDQAGRALSLAAQRGWRDTYTQVMVIGSALTGKRWDVAAQRLDALARLQREKEAIFGSLSLILREEEGRRALAPVMGNSEPLISSLADFVATYPEFGPEVAETFRLTQAGGGSLDCGQYARVTRTLLAGEQSEAALSVWPEKCFGEGGRSLAFTFGDAEADPFIWSYPSTAGVSVRKGSKDGLLSVRNRDPIRRQFAFRYVTLAPGSHAIRLSRSEKARTPGMINGERGEVQVLLRCDRRENQTRGALLAAEYEGPLTFEVPEGCPAQFLALSLSKGTVADLSVELD